MTQPKRKQQKTKHVETAAGAALAPATPRKVPVTARALIQRINRALAKRDGCVHGQEWPHRWDGVRSCYPASVLKIARGRAWLDVGEFYILDSATNAVAEPGVDLAALAHKLKVLQAWEEFEAPKT